MLTIRYWQRSGGHHVHVSHIIVHWAQIFPIELWLINKDLPIPYTTSFWKNLRREEVGGGPQQEGTTVYPRRALFFISSWFSITFFKVIFTQHRLWPFIVTRDQHTIHRRVRNPDCWVQTNLTQLNPFVFSFGNLTAKKIVAKRNIHNKECASLISISHNN